MKYWSELVTRRGGILTLRRAPRSLARMLAQVLIVAMMFTPLLTVGLQSPATAQDSTAAKSPFSKLKVKPGALHFKKLNLSTTPSESLSFTVSNTGTGTTLNVTVGAASAPFSVTSGGGAAALAPGAVATVTVQFAPAVSQKKAYKGTLSVTSDATKGKSSKTVKLSGKATGVLPSPTPTATPTPAAPSAGAPVGAMALAVTGAFAPPAVAVSTPASFPTPSGGITAKASPRGDSASQDSASSSAPAINPATPAGIISAYAPLGSWDEPATGVALISIAGGGASGKISTPMTVNSCASVPSGTFVAASTSPEAVCVSNGTDVYLIDGTTLVKTLTSGGGANSISFSGGSCTTCGVVVDSISGNAMISVATADGKGGYQILNLAAQTFSSVIPLGPNDGLAEHFAVFPLAPGFFLALSPTEGGITSGLDGPDYDILTIAPPTASSSGGDAIFDFSGRSVLSTTLEDTAALDSTAIIYALDEGSSGLFLADLSQATINVSTTPFTWNAPSQVQALTELTDGGDVDGMAVAFGVHEALVEQEFGGTLFGAVKLPATSGTGTPAAVDWVAANMPNPSSTSSWSNPLDPHGLTAAFVSYAITSGGVTTGTPHGFGLLMNDARDFVAVIDLDALLAAPRMATSGPGSHTLSSTVDLVASNIVTFVPFPP